MLGEALRAPERIGGFNLDAFARDLPHGFRHRKPERWASTVADLRGRAARALTTNGPGPLRRASFGDALSAADCEAPFHGISGVETVHFNAVASLDLWGDIALLVVISRPLPSDAAVANLTGAFFGAPPRTGYAWMRQGIRMRDDRVRAVRLLAHPEEQAETLRAAICDDELIQAIGRGRGVNRTMRSMTHKPL